MLVLEQGHPRHLGIHARHDQAGDTGSTFRFTGTLWHHDTSAADNDSRAIKGSREAIVPAAGDRMNRAKRMEEGMDSGICDFARKIAQVDQSVKRLDIRKANAVTMKTQHEGLCQVVVLEGQRTCPMTGELNSRKLPLTDSLDQLREEGGGASAVTHTAGKYATFFEVQ